MVFTPRDELERVPSFTEQERHHQEAIAHRVAEATPERLCDSCRERLDPVDDLHRTRHRGCTPPPIPPAAREALERLRARRSAR